MNKEGILLINLGTPDDPSVQSVRRYLREFLMDERVIDIPFIRRWFLVNVIIATFRGPKSAKEYQRLWTDRGSPLKFYSEDLCHAVQNELGNKYLVKLAMRYQNPTIKKALDEMKSVGVGSIKVIPLFPQYASASTGSVHELVMSYVKKWQVIPKIDFVSRFYDHPLFLETLADRAREKMASADYDYYLFSYHGLPERQILKADIPSCQLGDCCNSCDEKNKYCYRAQCFDTTKKLMALLDLPADKCGSSFQSRLGKNPWIKPYTDEVLEELANKGVKKVLAFSPAFVADCLETTLEVGETYKDDFIAVGGEQWDLVESLNVHPKWVACVCDLAKN